MAEPLQPRSSEDDPVEFTRVEFPKPRIDVAAQHNEIQSGEPMAQLNLPAQAAGSDAGAVRKLFEMRTIGNKRIARIFAFGNRRKVDALWKLKWNIFQT